MQEYRGRNDYFSMEPSKRDMAEEEPFDLGLT